MKQFSHGTALSDAEMESFRNLINELRSDRGQKRKFHDTAPSIFSYCLGDDRYNNLSKERKR